MLGPSHAGEGAALAGAVIARTASATTRPAPRNHEARGGFGWSGAGAVEVMSMLRTVGRIGLATALATLAACDGSPNAPSPPAAPSAAAQPPVAGAAPAAAPA